MVEGCTVEGCTEGGCMVEGCLGVVMGKTEAKICPEMVRTEGAG